MASYLLRIGKAVEEKEGAKADLEARLLKDEEEKTDTMKEAMATHEYILVFRNPCGTVLHLCTSSVSAGERG